MTDLENILKVYMVRKEKHLKYEKILSIEETFERYIECQIETLIEKFVVSRERSFEIKTQNITETSLSMMKGR